MPTAGLTARCELMARLPTGELLVPSADGDIEGALTCAGPDEFGQCPAELAGQRRLCAGAAWFYAHREHTRVWRFEFLRGSTLCPVAVLDPCGSFSLGPGGTPDPGA